MRKKIYIYINIYACFIFIFSVNEDSGLALSCIVLIKLPQKYLYHRHYQDKIIHLTAKSSHKITAVVFNDMCRTVARLKNFEGTRTNILPKKNMMFYEAEI